MSDGINYSVITITFNDGATIMETLESIGPEIRNDIEWVVVDAGSRDATWPLLEGYARTNPNIVAVRVISGGKPLTRGAGRALGARLARGDVLIHGFDTDVVFFPHSIVKIIKEYERGAQVAVGGDSYFACSRKDYFRAGGHSPEDQVAEDLNFYKRLTEHGIIYRSKVLNIEKFNHNPIQQIALEERDAKKRRGKK